MQEINVTFMPANGQPPRALTLRIGTPVKEAHSWSALIEVLGFDNPHRTTVHGEDWAQALELAAMVLPSLLQLMVKGTGGGTLDPPFYEREPRNTPIPPEIRAILDAP